MVVTFDPGPALVAALQDNLAAEIGAGTRDARVVPTPILQYLVCAINTKDTTAIKNLHTSGPFSNCFPFLITSADVPNVNEEANMISTRLSDILACSL